MALTLAAASPRPAGLVRGFQVQEEEVAFFFSAFRPASALPLRLLSSQPVAPSTSITFKADGAAEALDQVHRRDRPGP